MPHVYLERVPQSAKFRVNVVKGCADEIVREFVSFDAAHVFALAAVGSDGFLLDTTAMSAAQYAQYQARLMHAQQSRGPT